jgi:hypothetical protein
MSRNLRRPRLNNDDSLFAGFGCVFLLLWVVSAVTSIALVGVVIWAIINLVNKV